MSRYLVLDWDYQQLKILSATIKRGSVRIHQAVAFEEAQSPNPADAAALGKVLRERLKQAGIAPAPVIACVGRDRVVFKELRFPPVPEHEEPAIVRFQVVKELNEPADEVVIDYALTDHVGSGGERRGLAMVLRRELLNAYQTICQTAGVKLVAVMPRSFGTAHCLQRFIPGGVPADGAVACLIVDKTWAEFAIVKGTHLQLARALAVGPTLAGEVRRTLAVYSGQAVNHPIRAVYLADSGEQAAFRERLQSVAGVPVQLFDPLAGVEEVRVPAEARGPFAGAVGAVFAQAQGELPINFVKPKQPRPPRDIGKRRLAAVAAVAALLLVSIVGVCYAKLAARDRELDQLFEEKNNLDRELITFEDDVRRLKAYDEWSNSGIVWLDEFYDLTARFPDVNNIRLTQFAGDTVSTAKDTEKGVARIDLIGIARERAPINELVAKFTADGHYRLEPPGVKPNRAFQGRAFPMQFTLKVRADKLPPDKYIRRLSEFSRERGRERGDFGFFGEGQP